MRTVPSDLCQGRLVVLLITDVSLGWAATDVKETVRTTPSDASSTGRR